MKKVLIATEKPFAQAAIHGMHPVFTGAGYEMVLLEKYTSKAQLCDEIKDVDALIIRSDQIDAEVMDAAKQLKAIVRAGAGVDNVDLEAATSHHICVMNTPGQNANAVAELVMGLLVYAKRHYFQPKAGGELKGHKIGLHAYGNTAKNVARIAKGFGMDVYAYDPFCSFDVIARDGVTPVNSVEELYKTCDIVSLHIPATPETVKSINKNLLSMMPAGAVLVNSARKEVIDEAGLIELMAERSDFVYLTDVAPTVHTQLQVKFNERYFATPKKMGAQTAEANINAGIAAARQIVDFLENGQAPYQVNK